ncbi:MAG: glycosyltransferase family 2 protein [Patescibacteria group bacterium]|nr:glycosyltransferase family 2 protein [Patescibacteria group bacterium]
MNHLISIILPCRDEKETIGRCIEEAKAMSANAHIPVEIIVSDSSRDGSDIIAKQQNVTVIKHDREGYGLAIKRGVEEAQGDIIVYADADATYPFSDIPLLVKELEHADIVSGSRLDGHIERGAMPLAHRLLGTPMLNVLLRLFFGIRISDSQSGFRALKKSTFENLHLKTNGMEFTTEMLIKAKKNNLKIREIPITYSQRKGNSKLQPYKDGFAHVKYILMQVPLLFYFIGGGVILIIGLAGYFFDAPATIKILFPLIGVQIVFLGLFVKTYLSVHLGEKDDLIKKLYAFFRLKTAINFGVALMVIPLMFKIFGVSGQFFDPLLVSVIIGLQIIFNSLVLSSLSIK